MISSWMRWWPVVLLGLATIGAYGTVSYAIGVLIPAIGEATGWSTSALAGSFSLGLLGQGGLALLAGRVFDRAGSRPVMIAAIASGAVCLFGASFAATAWQFMIGWSLGAAVVGGGLFYSLTMPATTRLYPADRVAAFSVLTLLGALASPIFYPLTAWLVEASDWRGALQVLTGAMVLLVLPAAVFVRAPGALEVPGEVRQRTSLKASLREPVVQRTLLVLGLAGAANAAILLHQVAVLEATGLTLAMASAFAGARGAFQIGGRLLLVPLTARLGLRGTIGVCYGLAMTAVAALLLALQQPVGLVLPVYFAVVSGMSLGLMSPLNGLFQAESYGDARLGTLSGLSVVVVSVASAAGSALAGGLIDLTGGYEAFLLAAILLQAGAIGALVWKREPAPDPHQAAEAPLGAP